MEIPYFFLREGTKKQSLIFFSSQLFPMTLSSSSSFPPPSAVVSEWTKWVEETLFHLKSRGLIRDVKPLSTRDLFLGEEDHDKDDNKRRANRRIDDYMSKINNDDEPMASFDPVRARVDEETYERWLNDAASETITDFSTKSNKSFKVVTLFSSNDYLGLSANDRVRRAFSNAASEFGMGYRASQLIAGYTDYHRALEEKLSILERKSSCVLFPTGFAANMSVLQTLAERVYIKRDSNSTNRNNDSLADVHSTQNVEIFSDALNHASIVDGCRLAKAHVSIFKHLDYEELEVKLKKSSAKRKIVVTDAVFSIDGDVADIKRLGALKKKYPFLLIVDEAHSTLVYGEFGGGLAEAQDAQNDVDVAIGTLSKAVGAHGGFVCCSQEIKSILLSRGRGQIYSTSLPVPIVVAAIEALNVALERPDLANTLWRNVHYFHNHVLRQKNISCRMTVKKDKNASECVKNAFDIRDSHIVPIFCGDERTALRVAKHLLLRGFHAPAIRPPTVPENECVIRLAINVKHTIEDLDGLGDALNEAFSFGESIVTSRL